MALQNERVVGIQVVTTKDPEPIYVGSLAFLEEGGTTIFRGSGSEHRKMTRRRDLIWQVDLTEAEFGAAAVLEIGTVKYSTCDLVWDLEKLRETDGFGNALPRDKN